MKKAPRNYSQDMDRRRQGFDYVEDHLLPDVTSEDAGKIIKVSEDGAWDLGDDENTIIIPNPEGTASADLENLQIGSTIYAVNKPTFEVIRGIRLTIADGGEYRTDKPKVEFYDDAGNLMTYPAYTSSCDKSYAGNINLDQVCSVATSDAPGAFTYIFNADVVVSTYHLIKLTNAGSFAGDIAKNIKLELSSDGTNFSEIWSDPAIAWGGVSGASRMIDIKTGDTSNTILPIVTSADNGKVLSVVNGIWDKGVKLPVPTAGNNGQILTVKNGDYSLASGASVATLRLRSQYHVSYDETSETYNCYLHGEVNGNTINFPDGNSSLNVAAGTIIDFYIRDGSVIDIRGVFGVETSSVTKDNLSYYLDKAILYDVLNDRIVRVTNISFTSNKMYFKLTPIPAT